MVSAPKTTKHLPNGIPGPPFLPSVSRPSVPTTIPPHGPENFSFGNHQLASPKELPKCWESKGTPKETAGLFLRDYSPSLSREIMKKKQPHPKREFLRLFLWWWKKTMWFLLKFKRHLNQNTIYQHLISIGFLKYVKVTSLRLHGMSWGVKTTCFKAPGVSLGGSGVSIGGVRILRDVRNFHTRFLKNEMLLLMSPFKSKFGGFEFFLAKDHDGW